MRSRRRLSVFVVAAALFAAGAAYLASNSVTASSAGEGHGTSHITTTAGTGKPVVTTQQFSAP